MKRGELLHVRYTKQTDLGSGPAGEVTERYIVPTSIPSTNIKALDVTELSEEERAKVAKLYAQYAEYYEQAVQSLFKFEDWVEHTQDEEVRVPSKWRTFKIGGIELLYD